MPCMRSTSHRSARRAARPRRHTSGFSTRFESSLPACRSRGCAGLPPAGFPSIPKAAAAKPARATASKSWKWHFFRRAGCRARNATACATTPPPWRSNTTAPPSAKSCARRSTKPPSFFPPCRRSPAPCGCSSKPVSGTCNSASPARRSAAARRSGSSSSPS